MCPKYFVRSMVFKVPNLDTSKIRAAVILKVLMFGAGEEW
jgi:hypothetical protein